MTFRRISAISLSFLSLSLPSRFYFPKLKREKTAGDDFRLFQYSEQRWSSFMYVPFHIFRIITILFNWFN